MLAINSEKMSLDKTVERYERKAMECDVEARRMDVPYIARREAEKQKEEYLQMLEWMKELQVLRKEVEEVRRENFKLRCDIGTLRLIIAVCEADDWTPASEELPEEDDRYLVSFKKNCGIPCKVDICNYGVMPFSDFDDGEKHWYFGYSDYDVCMDKEVAAWQELPEVWKDGE